MPLGPNNDVPGGGRRRSASESDGDVMSSTLNPTDPVQINRFSNINNERCLSTPHINVTGFIDDSYSNNLGTRLETRIQTRSRGDSNSINMRLRNEYSRIRMNLFEWGEIATNFVQSLDVIESKHSLFCNEIEQCISEILLARGDYTLIGEFGNLKDRLLAIRREAKQLIREPPNSSVHDGTLARSTSARGSHVITSRDQNADNVFSDIPDTVNEQLSKTLPSSSKIGENQEVSRMGVSLMNMSARTVVASSRESRSTGLNLARQTHSYTQPQLDTVEIDLSQSLRNLLSDIPDLETSPKAGLEMISSHTDSWMNTMKVRQSAQEEKLENIHRTLITLNLAVQGAESMYKSVMDTVEDLKSNSSEIWIRLRRDESRLDKIEEEVERVDQYTIEKIKMVQDWIDDMRERPMGEVPSEIVTSIREVINDSAPGIALESIREEVRELRRTVSSGKHATEGLQDIVVNLSEQITRSPGVQTASPPPSLFRDEVELTSNIREREILRKGIERLEKQLKQLTQNILDEEPVDISLVKKCKTVDVPCVHTAVGNIQKALQKYVKFPGMDNEYCDYINEILDSAENWCLRIEEMYNKAEIHSINTSKGDTTDVGIFSDNAKVTVYEFLESAEIAYLGWGNSIQKANRLYNRHLSEEIKSKLINKSDSYLEMKQWLIQQYGGASRIVNDIISDLSKRTKPGPHDSNAKFSFYAYISGALQRLERLSKVNCIDKLELEICLYSRSTLSSLSLILPPKAYMEWITEMTRNGLDYKNPAGSEAYDVFKKLCIIERNTSEGSRVPESNGSPKPKPKSPRTKPKSAFKIQQNKEMSSEDENDPGVFATYHNKQWYPANLKFPCPIGNHKHEMSMCAEFFSLSPVERWNKMDKGKLCYACLQPKDVCTVRKCSFEALVPETLKCHGCAPWAHSKNLAPFNILFCRTKDHSKLRADFKDMKKDLEKYIGKLGTTVVDSNIRFAANYTYQVYSLNPNSANALGWNQDNFKDKHAPSINSQTGRMVPTQDQEIIKEVAEHSCYLMQTVKIGDSEALIFFDRGANIHIIDGALAEKEGLQKVSSTPTSLTVVGGNKVRSQHGTYRFNLGPGEKGEFHEVVCIGMDDVTSGFGSYDLGEICEEFRNSAEDHERDILLPRRVGGSRVHLLLGIKNTNLDPIFVKRLQSGVAVYISPFKDIYGSRIIFAGPHRSFNPDVPMTNAVFFMREKINKGFECETDDRVYSLITEKSLGTSIHPHPITEDDIVDIGGIIPEQFEESLDDLKRVMEIQDGFEPRCSVHKAFIPIAKFRNAIDDADKDDSVAFRCTECTKCITCKTSVRRTAISLQESREQEFIEDSVMIDTVNRRVTVNYPFLKDPIEFLSARHHGRNNYAQAERVYLSQCRKSDLIKEGMRKVHKDLVEKGFMVKLDVLDTGRQELIRNAPFQHFNPWRLVAKTDSVSTPVRMVVDPTMTGFNIILAKGENRLGLIFTILIRSRCIEHIWSSDISKLYNQLFMDNPSLPYSLFLFNESLDPKVKPDIWVMVRAWYGIVSTGGQAGHALDKLTEMYAEEFPKACKPLRENRYVDDLLSGDDTEHEREEQIQEVKEVLKRGGFSLKFVVKSGEKPSEKASTDGESLKLLGYKWDSEQDILSPGLGELNMNKKVRGEKKPNLNPIRTELEAESLLANVKLTRSLIVGKISEFFDPCGFFEPIKLQMKLQTQTMKGRGWDEVLPDHEQEMWKDILKGYVNLPEIKIPRFCLPSNKLSCSKIRLICLADAAEFAGGAAIYAGRELSPGNWSCSLLAAKSKMMSGTIPRNELSAILLCTELAFMVKVALGDKIGEVIYVTDSTIALSWCSNPTIKLRLFVYNRVVTILRMIEWTTGSKMNHLHHIDGNLNLADLLTKKHEIGIEHVSQGSEWIEGLEWMRKSKYDMPLVTYDHLRVEKPVEDEIKVECFPDAFTEKFTSEKLDLSSKKEVQILNDEEIMDESDDDEEELSIPFCVLAVKAGRSAADVLLVNPVYQGWRRALRIIGYMQSWSKKHKHMSHNEIIEECRICMLGEARWDPRNQEKEAMDYLFRWETDRIKQIMKPSDITKYVERENILYDDGRLGAEFQFKSQDLDKVGYLDMHEIINQVPVVMCDSPILYAYLMYVHVRTNVHAALEPTIKEIHKMMKVPRGLRKLVKRIISDCMKCKLLSKRTLELKMAIHPEPRSVLAPCFHSCMMDICYGFKGQAYKRARTVIKIYGLVIVCLLSGATNIMALEGIETQDVCTAVERHSNRHGVPGFIYVDNGTQLKALQYATFSIRDLEAQVQDSLGIKIIVSNAKAHSERGRVERRIRVLRESMEKLGVQTSVPMTCMQWDALFSRISNTIDNLPIARGDTSNETALGYDIITPNRLKLGRNNFRSLEGCGINLDMSSNFTKLLDRNRDVYRSWYQTFMDNVHLLNLRPNKWLRSSRSPIINDIVLFVFNDGNLTKESTTWKLGKVSKLENNRVSITYFTKSNGKEQVLVRSIRDISIVYSVGEMMINTLDHFNDCAKHTSNEEIILRTPEFRKRIKERRAEQRSKEYDPELSMLIPQRGEKNWGEKRKANKIEMVGQLVGYRHRMNNGKDNLYMEKYLKHVSRTGLDKPRYLSDSEFLPIDAPLLDYLVEDTRSLDGWKYPKIEELEKYQEKRGLDLEMLKEIEVRELVCGISSDTEIENTRKWIIAKHKEDQDLFETRIVSMDVEDVKVTFYDTLRMAGKVEIRSRNAVLQTRPDTELIHGYSKDVWKQIPGKIMFGNGLSWVCIISLDLEKNEKDEYVLRKMFIQSGILNILRCLPVSAGLGVRRDVRGVQEFYSLISGTELVLENGCLDLTSLAIVAGYKFHAKNMTAMGVQVIGTLLNKVVSTGDELWGLRWPRIPDPLQCYALGDIKFGFISYNVLAGLLLRDIFPDPDIICRYLETDQHSAVTWFLDWILLSLQGVEFHPAAEGVARTRSEMICSLRFRDDRDKLYSEPPTYIKLWTEILGSWPSVTNGGCRFLIQCREWCMVQMRSLSRANVPWASGLVIRLPKESDLEYARFGLTPEMIGPQSWSDPAPDVKGMGRPPRMMVGTLEFDPSTTRSSEIGAKCTELKRSQRWSIMEWARLHPEKFRLFFVRMVRDTGFRLFYKNMYDGLRICYLRVFDDPAPKVPRVEQELNQAVRNTLAKEKEVLKKLEVEAETRRARVAWLEDLASDWSMRERTRWKEGIPDLPSWKKRSGQKRSYSKVRSKPGKDKRKRIRLDKRIMGDGVAGSSVKDHALDSSVQVSPQLSLVVDRIESKDRNQDSGSSVKGDEERVVAAPETQRSGGIIRRRDPVTVRSARLDAYRFRTYDEQIEGIGDDEVAFPDNLNFQFEIPQEVEDIEV